MYHFVDITLLYRNLRNVSSFRFSKIVLHRNNNNNKSLNETILLYKNIRKRKIRFLRNHYT